MIEMDFHRCELLCRIFWKMAQTERAFGINQVNVEPLDLLRIRAGYFWIKDNWWASDKHRALLERYYLIDHGLVHLSELREVCFDEDEAMANVRRLQEEIRGKEIEQQRRLGKARRKFLKRHKGDGA